MSILVSFKTAKASKVEKGQSYRSWRIARDTKRRMCVGALKLTLIATVEISYLGPGAEEHQAHWALWHDALVKSRIIFLFFSFLRLFVSKWSSPCESGYQSHCLWDECFLFNFLRSYIPYKLSLLSVTEFSNLQTAFISGLPEPHSEREK